MVTGLVKAGRTGGRICKKSDVSRDPKRAEARMAKNAMKNRVIKSPRRSRRVSARIVGSRARVCPVADQ